MSALRIAADSVVALHYTLTLDSGERVDSSIGGEPLLYLHGHGNIVPGLEEQLATLPVGAKAKVAVPAAQGYGEKQPDATWRVPRSSLPDDVPIEVGMQLEATDDDGEAVPVFVAEVGDEEIVLDFNHPLAGETLHFEIEVMSVRAATKEELQHGHPHGPGGHHHH